MAEWSVGVSLAPDGHPSALALVQVAPTCCILLWLATWRDGPRGLLPRLPTLGPGASTLVVECTATGGAGLDLLRRAGFHPKGVMLSTGHAVEHADGLTWLPYLRLLAPVRRVLGQRRLTISPALPERERVRRALVAFRLPLGVEAATVAAWRDEADTALVAALAVAIWAVEACPAPTAVLAGPHRILWHRDHGSGVYPA